MLQQWGTNGQSVSKDREQSIDVKIVRRVAEEADVDPLDLPPLNRTVDVDAVERVLSSSADGGQVDVELRFEYAGYAVTVAGDGAISVETQS